jgi:ribonuclease Z
MILGSASAIPVEEHENTHLVLFGGKRTVLVDCSSNPIQHLRRAGVVFDQLTDFVLTHFHPDHVSGAPLLLMGMWLMGRRHPLHLYGLEYTIVRMRTMMELFDYQTWPNFYPLIYHPLAEEELSLVLEDEALQLFSSPVKHLIPTIGLRAVFWPGNKIAAYSCDTEPCRQTVQLAQDADLLIHEATGASIGHSSAQQAAEIGRQAGARQLCLIHYPPEVDAGAIIGEARKIFRGPVHLAKDFMEFNFD